MVINHYNILARCLGGQVVAIGSLGIQSGTGGFDDIINISYYTPDTPCLYH